MSCLIEFPSRWMNATALEQVLDASCNPHNSSSTEIEFRFPAGSKVMIDAGLRLLSLFNQLDLSTRRVRLHFDEGEAGVMGYLNRMGFFDHLSTRIEVVPARPGISGVGVYGGMNAGLVEIARINPEARDNTLLSRLTSALMKACGNQPDAADLEGSAWTIFAELIDNIFSHSKTTLDGFAALQKYKNGNRLMVAVSDSGLGIMETLRPALKQESPVLAQLSDLELLVEIFRQGVSRHGNDRGCGLKGSAAKAMKYKADLDVRLPNFRVLLKPGVQGYRPVTAHCDEQLPLIWGTHICFTFQLDNSN